MRLKGAALAAFMLAAVGATLPAAAQTLVQLGVPFGMRIGDTVEIEGHVMTVTLTALVEDSRCPIDALCIQAGRVVIGLAVTVGLDLPGRPAEDVTIDTMGETATVAGVVLNLLQAKPSRRSTETIEPEDMGFLLRADIISP